MTSKRKACLDAIRAYMAANGGVSPSVDDLAHALGKKSKSGVHASLVALERDGHITRAKGCARSIRLPETHMSRLRVLLIKADRALVAGDVPAARLELGLAARIADGI